MALPGKASSMQKGGFLKETVHLQSVSWTEIEILQIRLKETIFGWSKYGMGLSHVILYWPLFWSGASRPWIFQPRVANFPSASSPRSPFMQKNRLSAALRYSNWKVRFENLSMFCTVSETSGQVMLKMRSTRAPSICVSGTCFTRPSPVCRITSRLRTAGRGWPYPVLMGERGKVLTCLVFST